MPRSKHPWPQTPQIHVKLEDQFLNFIIDHISFKSGKKCVFGEKIKEAYLGGQGSGLQAFSSCGGRRLITHSVSSAVSLVCLFRQVTTASWTPAHNKAQSLPALCTWRGS